MRTIAVLATALAIFPLSLLSAAEITPYEATFTSTLREYYGPGELQAWEGTMQTSLSRDCQKWKSKTEIVYRFTVSGVTSELRAVSMYYEALDGNRIEFDTRTELDGRVLQRKKGGAKLQGEGKPGVAKYRVPQGEILDLPAGTMFVVASWRASIDQLGTGKKQWKQLVFIEGELTDFLYSVRKRGIAAPAGAKGDANLISQPGWLIDINMNGRQSGTDILATFLSHPNGAASLYIHNNDMFSSLDELVEIRALPTPQC